MKVPAPKRLLMTADTVGGVWSYALELAGVLDSLGTEIVLMTMGGLLSGVQREAVMKLHRITVFETDLRLEWMESPWEEVDRAGKQLLELERDFAPDLVHLNGYAHGGLPWESPVLVVAHSCVLSWWQAVHGKSAPAQYREYRQRVQEGLRAAGGVVAPSWAMLASLKQHYDFPQSGRVIPNGVEASRFFPAIKEPVVLAAGRLWDEAKNFAVLDRVSPRLSWPVVIAGDSRHPNGGKRSFPNLTYLGSLPQEALAKQMGRTSIYALPARYEPFGLSIVEAALSGCALVLGDLPSLREIWGEAAIYVDSHDENSVYEGIAALIASPDWLTEMSCRARHQALRYSADRMAREYLRVYQELTCPPVHQEALP